MISFFYETDFKTLDEPKLMSWVKSVIGSNDFNLGEINYIFCDDEYLLKLNQDFLDHDTLTDIISFDYTLGKLLSGDIFISVERVKENAGVFGVNFDNELARVMIHGVLHFMGLKDKSEQERLKMRDSENQALELLNN